MATTPLRFGIKFILVFALLTGAFEASRGSSFERFLVEDLILVPTTHLINANTPNEHVSLVGRTISSPDANLRVTRGCEGIEMFILLIAAIVAFPASPKRLRPAKRHALILAWIRQMRIGARDDIAEMDWPAACRQALASGDPIKWQVWVNTLFQKR